MSLITSFALTQNLGELNSPLFLGSNPANPMPPLTRKLNARANLGLFDAQAANVQAPSAVNATTTLNAGQVFGAVITSTTAAAVTATLPTGAAMDSVLQTLFPNLPVGAATTLTIVNTGPNTFTLAAGASGFTIVGATAIPTATSGTYLVVRTAAATWVAYRE